MYSIVAVDPNKEYGVTRFSEWKTIQDGMKRNLIAMLEHYRRASYSVEANHLLATLLQSINVPLSLNSERYYSNIFPNALATANALKFTTPFGTGNLFKGVFFNKSITEVVIAHVEEFNMEKVERNWENVTPVRVLRHPFTNLRLQVPNGRYIATESGIAFIAVNVALLAVQYRAFVFSENFKQSVDKSYVPRNVMQFLHAYVLPNMLESYLDYALFNRMDALANDRPMYYLSHASVINQHNYQPQVDSVYTKVLDVLNKTSYTAPAILAAVPSCSTPDMRSVMFVPDVAPTRQILWSTVASRLPMIRFLTEMSKKDQVIRNQYGLSDVKEILLRLTRQKVFESTLPKEILQPTMDTIHDILSVL